MAVSAEATVGNRTLDDLLAGARLRTRRRHAAVAAGRLLEGGFGGVGQLRGPALQHRASGCLVHLDVVGVPAQAIEELRHARLLAG